MKRPNIYGRKVTEIYVNGQYETTADSKRAAIKYAAKLRDKDRVITYRTTLQIGD